MERFRSVSMVLRMIESFFREHILLGAIDWIRRKLVGKGRRIPDGTPGIRDQFAVCEAYYPWWDRRGHRFFDCGGDGHYLCKECVHFRVEEEP